MALTIVEREGTYTATIDTTVDVDLDGDYQIWVTLTHDWGFTVVAETLATRTDVGEYEYAFTASDLDSSGVHKIHWRYEISAVESTTDQYIEIVQKHVSNDDFFDTYPELSDEFEVQYDWYEKQARRIIEPFCGQEFQFISTGILTYDGDGTSSLPLHRRLDSFSEVTIGTDGDDITDLVEFYNNDQNKRYLRYATTGDEVAGYTRSTFAKDADVQITGDWGWPYVPETVKAASLLLIYELMLGDRVNYTAGIDQVWMDTQRTEFRDALFDTTGNLDVDTLLMDYTILEVAIV